jgi:hypothetical protein
MGSGGTGVAVGGTVVAVGSVIVALATFVVVVIVGVGSEVGSGVGWLHALSSIKRSARKIIEMNLRMGASPKKGGRPK